MPINTQNLLRRVQVILDLKRPKVEKIFKDLQQFETLLVFNNYYMLKCAISSFIDPRKVIMPEV